MLRADSTHWAEYIFQLADTGSVSSLPPNVKDFILRAPLGTEGTPTRFGFAAEHAG